MLNAILSTLSIMGWLGIILGILVVTNTLSGTLYNIYEKKEKFSLKKLFKGLGKALIFYISSSLLSVAFTMLPYINEMITDSFGVVLLSNDLLNTLSSAGVLGVVVASIVAQGKKAIEGTTKLAGINSNNREEE
jgi:hypothetical protein